MTSPGTRVLTAHIALPLVEKIDQMAERLERSRGWIIKQALTSWIEQEERRRQLTLDALADVDGRRVVDQEVMETWAAGLDSHTPAPPSP